MIASKYKFIVLFFSFSCLMSSCASDYASGGYPIENDSEIYPKAELTVDVSDRVKINENIFGVNNDWRQIPETKFSSFVGVLNILDYKLMRYPGGWESEYYDWETNTTPNWKDKPTVPGVSIGTLKSSVNNYNIVIPTADAMNKILGTNEFNFELKRLQEITISAINQSGADNTEIVEIGNEWWLQWGGGVNRKDKLLKYTYIAMNLAESISLNFPNKKFKLLVNGDYTQPEEFTLMKENFTKAYQEIDGIALHTYTGYETDTHNIKDLEVRIKACANNFNSSKSYIYLSEWMPSRDYNGSKLYMQAANLIPDIIQIYARTGVDAAAYWPPVNSSIPGLGFFNWNFTTVFPVGQIFGELSTSYKGSALKVESQKVTIAAALNEDEETVVLFVCGGEQSATKTTIKINGFSIKSVDSVKKFIPGDYSETNKALSYITEDATINLKRKEAIELVINKEGMYQIYKIVLRGKIKK